MHALICVWAVAVTGALGVLAKYIEKHKDAGITSAFMELGTSLSFAAASCNDSETIDYLHDAGVNLSTGRAGDGVTPLIAAAALESIEAMDTDGEISPDVTDITEDDESDDGLTELDGIPQV